MKIKPRPISCQITQPVEAPRKAGSPGALSTTSGQSQGHSLGRIQGCTVRKGSGWSVHPSPRFQNSTQTILVGEIFKDLRSFPASSVSSSGVLQSGPFSLTLQQKPTSFFFFFFSTSFLFNFKEDDSGRAPSPVCGFLSTTLGSFPRAFSSPGALVLARPCTGLCLMSSEKPLVNSDLRALQEGGGPEVMGGQRDACLS